MKQILRIFLIVIVLAIILINFSSNIYAANGYNASLESVIEEAYKKGGIGDVKIKKFLISILEEELTPIYDYVEKTEISNKEYHIDSLEANQQVEIQFTLKVKNEGSFTVVASGVSNEYTEAVNSSMLTYNVLPRTLDVTMYDTIIDITEKKLNEDDDVYFPVRPILIESSIERKYV